MVSRENLAVRTALLGKNLEVKKRIIEKKKIGIQTLKA